MLLLGVIGYRVYRNGKPVLSVTDTQTWDVGLAPGTAYTYAVAAVDAAGNVSAQCASASVMTH